MNMIYAHKYQDKFIIAQNIPQEQLESFLSVGYKPVQEGIIPSDYNSDTMELQKEIVERENGDYEYKYTAVVNVARIEKSISLLKQQLSETDYKVIKNMEATMANELLPYNANELHSERQAIRDKINELEQLLNE